MDNYIFQKKYSKISPALKCYFLHSLYFKRMTIKEASLYCKLNYSTAKVVIRDLSVKQRKYIKIICERKEKQLKNRRLKLSKECFYRDIIEKEKQNKEKNQSLDTNTMMNNYSIEIISRTGFDFFSQDQKINQE